MIFNMNRTNSLIEEIEGSVNENYLGSGALMFMEENAQDELALFEAAIKADYEEFSAVTEAEDEEEGKEKVKVLSKEFVTNTVNKIQEMMKKFIDWLKSISRSVVMKMMQYLSRDNAKFCKEANSRIGNVKEGFTYKGKALKHTDKIDIEALDKIIDYYKNDWETIVSATELNPINEVKEKLAAQKKELSEKCKKALNEELVYTEENGTLDLVKKHIDFLESGSKETLKAISAKIKEYEAWAKKIASDAKKANRAGKKADPVEKNRLAVMAQCAAYNRDASQMLINTELKAMKKSISVARAVVANALRAVPASKVNEGIEFDDELMTAFIETTNYELDELFEEVSEASDCCAEEVDDIADDNEEEK